MKTQAPSLKGDDVLGPNAHRTLRICLAVSMLLLFADMSFAARTHIVRKGQTLYRIAKNYHTSIYALQKINHLGSVNRIKTGQVLRLTPQVSPTASNITYGRPNIDGLEVLANGEPIATLNKNDKFKVISRDADEYNIKLEDGKVGRVSVDDVTLEETRKPLPVSDKWSMKRDVVRTAYAFRGARYRSGGVSGRGFDCSGFVKYVYATKGIKLPHSSRAQFHCGTPVAKSSLQPGDMIFFAGTYRRGISHVGIYMGEGKFIHASTHRGGVRVDELDAAYYRRRYAGARRL